MSKSKKLFKILSKNRLIALLTPQSAKQCITAYETFQPLNITLEIAFRSEHALKGIKAILKKYPDALLLAGTVMTKEHAEQAVDAGVAGVVSADYIADVVDVCVWKDIMCIPGGLSDLGKQLVQKTALYKCPLEELKEKYPYQWIYKVFPAITSTTNNIGLSKAMLGPFRDVQFVYTGGVSLENLQSAVDLDPKGIFCGSALTKEINNPEKMKEEAEKWLDIIHGKISTPPKEKAAKSIAQAKPKVITFGEIMMRLATPDKQRFVQTDDFKITFGGAEANISVALANFGLDSVFVSALPEHELAQAAVNSLRKFGVDTSFIHRDNNRLGIYFLEHGVSQRPSKVIYDRRHSSISKLEPGQIDWSTLFKNADWFHWSGITPALSDSTAAVTLEALQAAKKANVTVSVDLNYRKKLWSKEKAQLVITPLMDYVDIAIGNEEDAESFFGIKSKSTDVTSGKLNIEGYKDVTKQLKKRFNLQKVAITLRESLSASINKWSGCLDNGKNFLLSKNYEIHLIDRVGGGDSFCSGLIYALLSGKADSDALEFAVAASCLKQTILGDFNLVSVSEVELLSGGDTSGRVQR
jgi:2-dehydro-3-deoxygluconokinase